MMVRFSKCLLITTIVFALAGCGDSEPGKAGKLPSTPKVTASSQLGELGPQGLFSNTAPGWHSERPPKFPESLTVDFQTLREIKHVGILQQEGQPARAPKALRIEISNDGNSWTQLAGSDNACSPNMPDGWFNIDFSKPYTGRYLKVIIFSNCGDAQLLTLRGLRVG